jgi:hypothetical protein
MKTPTSGATITRLHVEVHHFLSACKPPMDRFLPHFIDFGCGNREFLQAISAWAPDKRNALLRKILGLSAGRPPQVGDSDDHPASEMDLAVIENQFETYLWTVSSRVL